MTLLVVLLTWASLHVQYRIYLTNRRPAPAEGGESNRSEMRPSVSQ